MGQPQQNHGFRPFQIVALIALPVLIPAFVMWEEGKWLPWPVTIGSIALLYAAYIAMARAVKSNRMDPKLAGALSFGIWTFSKFTLQNVFRTGHWYDKLPFDFILAALGTGVWLLVFPIGSRAETALRKRFKPNPDS